MVVKISPSTRRRVKASTRDRSRSRSSSELAANTAVPRAVATTSTARLMLAEKGLATESSSSPSVQVLCPLRRSAPAPRWGLKLSATTASCTRSRVDADTLASSLITRETVLMPTPARAATSRIVARARVPGVADIGVSVLSTPP
jgi:hypothetical protein